MDERFIMHRLRSTRLAALVAVVAMAVWFNVEYFVHDIARWDLFVIMMLTALTKVGAMIYFRHVN